MILQIENFASRLEEFRTWHNFKDSLSTCNTSLECEEEIIYVWEQIEKLKDENPSPKISYRLDVFENRLSDFVA